MDALANCHSTLWGSRFRQVEVDGGVGYLAESGHERRYLAVVCGVHICACLHQQLHHIKMATIGRQPQGGVALLVTHINVSPSAQKQQRKTQHYYSSYDCLYACMPSKVNGVYSHPRSKQIHNLKGITVCVCLPIDEQLTELVVTLVCSNSEGGVA